MPIEIKELYIRAVIDGGGSSKPAQPGAESGQPAAGASAQPSEQLVELCVEKVMEVLKEKMER